MEGMGASLPWQEPRKDPEALIQGFISTQVVGRGLDGRTREAYRIDLERFHKWLDGEDAEKREQRAGWEAGPAQGEFQATAPDGMGWQDKMEAYLEYLAREKGLRPSTIARKYRVFTYYLSYLVRQGILRDRRPLKPRQIAGRTGQREPDTDNVRDENGTADLVGADDLGSRNGVDPSSDMDGAADWKDEDHAEPTDDRGGAGHAGHRMSKRDVDAFFLALDRTYAGLENDFRKRVCLRDWVMMELLFYHGIEVSELLRLETRDYDGKNGVLTVRKKRGKEICVYLYSRGLRERMERWRMEHGYFEHEAEYRGRMFLSKLGKPLSMKMVINIFDKYRVMAGIEKEVTPKDLKGCMGEYAREWMMERCS